MEETVIYQSERIKRQEFQASLLGPAWHEVKEPSKYEPAYNNVSFGRTRRFIGIYDKDVPGPGTYNLAEPYKAPHGPHSDLPTFLHTPLCRFKPTTPNWHLSPNRYTIIDKGDIEYLPKKIVSLKGPYRLFTGKRDASTIYNHYRTNIVTAATWPWALPSSLDAFKKKRGITSKTNMSLFPRHRVAVSNLANMQRNSNEPGPADYCPEPIMKKWKRYKYGFNSSCNMPRSYVRRRVWPAVGCYNVRPKPCCAISGHGHKSVFMSKTKRTGGSILRDLYNCF